MAMNPVFVDEMFKSLLSIALTNGASASARDFERRDKEFIAYVNSYDLVFAVWADPKAESGFVHLPVKGWDAFKDMSEGRRPSTHLRFTALPAANAEHAVSLLHFFGDPTWLSALTQNEPPRLN
jgi:hypothetical protein